MSSPISTGGVRASPGDIRRSRFLKVNEDYKQYNNLSGMATFTIATFGLMKEAKLGGEKFKYEPPSGGFFAMRGHPQVIRISPQPLRSGYQPEAGAPEAGLP